MISCLLLVPTAGFAWQAEAAEADEGKKEVSFEDHLRRLEMEGLDVVVVFDSTGSMSGEINRLKRSIGRLHKSLSGLVPKTRIGICTYRDQTDAYLVKGIPLTDDLAKLEGFLKDVHAGGGGDFPEAVQAGLNWTLENSKFRRRARKVLVVFGDAPPHNASVKDCLKLATDFAKNQHGILNTITCRQSKPLDAFEELATKGKGRSQTLLDDRKLVPEIAVMAIGDAYREQVLKKFEE